MSDAVIIGVTVAICGAIPPTLVAIATLIKVRKVHRELNSRLSQWKEETMRANEAANIAAKAEGVKEEKERH